MLVETVGGGFLGTVNLGLPFLVRALPLARVFVMAYYSIFSGVIRFTFSQAWGVFSVRPVWTG